MPAQPVVNVSDLATAKNEFLTSMGHELRNPLTSIIAHVETLLEGVYGPLENAQKTALQSVQDSSRHLLHLIADVVDLGRIETGTAPLQPTTCRLSEKCERCLEQVADLARSRSTRITTDIQPQNLSVMADARRLQQMITELLSAAVLTIPTHGQVRLHITPEKNGLRFQVQGSPGHHTPSSDHSSVKAEDAAHSPLLSRLRKLKPIGMALLQQLVQLQGGTFTVHETAEHAISLSVHLPLGLLSAEEPMQEPHLPSSPPMAELPPSASSHSPTILIADDQPALVTVTRNYLESLGFQVITARDGREAVQLACSLKPDLILMDVRMPVVDGLTAIRQIRESSDPAIRDIAIVTLSGMAGAADQEKCLAVGATAHLNKPFGVRDLDRIIASFIQAPQILPSNSGVC